MNSLATPARATRREWIGLAVLALPCLVYAMDLTVLNLALPALTTQLKTSSSQLLWIVDIYGFFVAAFLITMGTLGDRIGRRKLLLVGAAAFAIASIIAASANSAEMLIASRALLGIAGATVAPSTMSLIRHMFHDQHERQLAIGIWIASFSAGAVIGPLVGGALLHFFSWSSVFLAAVPVMVLVLVLGPVLLPEYRDPNAGKLDLPSVALSLLSVLLSIYGLKQMAEYGISPLALACLILGLLIGIAFVRRQQRLEYPLLDLSLFKQAKFSGAIIPYAFSCLAMFGVYVFITQYLQLVLGMPPLAAGLATMPWAIGFVAGSLLAPRLTRHMPQVKVFVWGLSLAALGFACITQVGGPFGLWWLIAGTVFMSLGMSPVFTIGNEMIITAAPPERAGAASALSETVSEFSGALGIALFGSIGTLLYRKTLVDTMPSGVPAETANKALSTLGAAIDLAHSLPAASASLVVESARSAFVGAFQISAVLGGIIVLVAALIARRILAA